MGRCIGCTSAEGSGDETDLARVSHGSAAYPLGEWAADPDFAVAGGARDRGGGVLRLGAGHVRVVHAGSAAIAPLLLAPADQGRVTVAPRMEGWSSDLEKTGPFVGGGRGPGTGSGWFAIVCVRVCAKSWAEAAAAMAKPPIVKSSTGKRGIATKIPADSSLDDSAGNGWWCGRVCWRCEVLNATDVIVTVPDPFGGDSVEVHDSRDSSK